MTVNGKKEKGYDTCSCLREASKNGEKKGKDIILATVSFSIVAETYQRSQRKCGHEQLVVESKNNYYLGVEIKGSKKEDNYYGEGFIVKEPIPKEVQQYKKAYVGDYIYYSIRQRI